MEVEAVDEGVVSALLVPEGAEGVKVNAPIARLGGEACRTRRRPLPARLRIPRQKEPAPASPPLKSNPPLETSAPREAAEEKSSVSEPVRRSAGSPTRIPASPLARRIAAQRGLDLGTIKGSGPHGRIIRRDVENASPSAPGAIVEVPSPEPAQAPSLEQMGIAAGSYKLVPLDGMRKTVARRLTDAFRDIPHFPLTIDLAIDELLSARARINALLEPTGVKVSVNDLVIKAAALALMRAPEANASYTPEGIAMHQHADIAVAVAVEGGLITPIIRRAEEKSLATIATEMKDLAARARARKLKPEEYQGGTFSISNLGMFGIRSFASIINPPQGAILSVGAGEKRPVVVGDALTVATVMTVTLTCDHRVIGGAEGSKFLNAFKAFVEQPITMLA